MSFSQCCRVSVWLIVGLSTQSAFAGWWWPWKPESTVRVEPRSALDLALLDQTKASFAQKQIDSFKYFQLAEQRRLEVEAQIEAQSLLIQEKKAELLKFEPQAGTALLAPVKWTSQAVNLVLSKAKALTSAKGKAADLERQRKLGEASRLQSELSVLRYGDPQNPGGMKDLGRQYTRVRTDFYFLENPARLDSKKLKDCYFLNRNAKQSKEKNKEVLKTCVENVKSEIIPYDKFIQDPVLLERIHQANHGDPSPVANCATCTESSSAEEEIQKVENSIATLKPVLRRTQSAPAMLESPGEAKEEDQLRLSESDVEEDLTFLQDDSESTSLSSHDSSSSEEPLPVHQPSAVTKKQAQAALKKVSFQLGVSPNVGNKTATKTGGQPERHVTFAEAITEEDEHAEIQNVLGSAEPESKKEVALRRKAQVKRAAESAATVAIAQRKSIPVQVDQILSAGYNAIATASLMKNQAAPSVQHLQSIRAVDQARKALEKLKGRTGLDAEIEDALLLGFSQKREEMIDDWLKRFQEEQKESVRSSSVSAAVSSAVAQAPRPAPVLKMLPIQASSYARIAWIQGRLEGLMEKSDQMQEDQKQKKSIAPEFLTEFRKDVELFVGQVKDTQTQLSRGSTTKEQDLVRSSMFHELEGQIKKFKGVIDSDLL